MIEERESTERIEELLTRNLKEIFGEADEKRRRAAIEELWAEDGVLYVPPGPVIGYEAINKVAGQLRAAHPNYVYTPNGKPQVLHNAGRLAWGSGPRDQAPAYSGWDVMIVRNGKIVALYVFLDETSEEFRRVKVKL
ncbi:SnoaL-like domain-containing protein [Kaistia soli DSM 19436]|uniref:SnoaL-like domain-containing protein n=2 Tax=Kaistia TaxID=166953 RepID=A0A1M5L9B1_9HYPH|nr:SnoaL-like domain-containing protein [Kaistia soli DSM 19436]